MKHLAAYLTVLTLALSCARTAEPAGGPAVQVSISAVAGASKDAMSDDSRLTDMKFYIFREDGSLLMSHGTSGTSFSTSLYAGRYKCAVVNAATAMGQGGTPPEIVRYSDLSTVAVDFRTAAESCGCLTMYGESDFTVGSLPVTVPVTMRRQACRIRVTNVGWYWSRFFNDGDFTSFGITDAFIIDACSLCGLDGTVADGTALNTWNALSGSMSFATGNTGKALRCTPSPMLPVPYQGVTNPSMTFYCYPAAEGRTALVFRTSAVNVGGKQYEWYYRVPLDNLVSNTSYNYTVYFNGPGAENPVDPWSMPEIQFSITATPWISDGEEVELW